MVILRVRQRVKVTEIDSLLNVPSHYANTPPSSFLHLYLKRRQVYHTRLMVTK